MRTACKAFEVQVPTRLLFGVGQVERLGEVARELGRRAMLVTYRDRRGMEATIPRVSDILGRSGLEVVLFDRVEPNPLTTTADAGAELARQENCEVVVGLGGGSAIDTAKCVALAAANPGSIWEYMPSGDGEPRVPTGALPIVAVATTSGTGSEMNKNAVLTNPVTREKPGMGHPLLHPRVAIVDPALMVSIPPRVTASTGIDVFYHALEGYIHVASQPFTDLLCVEAIELVVCNLKHAIECGDDVEARCNMAWASSLAGIVIDISSVVLLHAAGHPICAYHDAPHGETLVALTRPFMERTWPLAPGKFARVAQLLGADVSGLPLEEAARRCGEALDRFLAGVGLEVTLASLGARPELVREYARNAFKTMQGCIQGHPAPLTEDDIAGLYDEAFRAEERRRGGAGAPPASCAGGHEVTAERARRVIEASHRKARELGVTVVTAVVDEGGHLVALERMDGGQFICVDLAVAKAFTAAAFREPTLEFGRRTQPGQELYGINSCGLGRIAVFGGGIPLIGPDGRVVGGVGVSGSPTPTDVMCSEAGASAFRGLCAVAG